VEPTVVDVDALTENEEIAVSAMSAEKRGHQIL
jgi:hypothetical protein